MDNEEPAVVCLGPDGSAAKVMEALALIDGCRKLAILFRLFAKPSVHFLALLRDIAGVSQKMLTQHLRELERDGLIIRQDFDEKPRRVEYRLSPQGHALRPALTALRDFARNRPAPKGGFGGGYAGMKESPRRCSVNAVGLVLRGWQDRSPPRSVGAPPCANAPPPTSTPSGRRR